MTRELYTTSRLRVLRTCPRKHHLRYRLGIIDPGSEAMAFGTAAHAALEAWLVEWRDNGPTDARLAAAFFAIRRSPVGDVDKAKLRAIMVAYDAKWGEKNWEILTVEVEFRYRFGAFDIGGKIDAIIRDLDDGGRVFVLEHKTSSWDTSPGSAYWEKLTIDCQLSIYVDGASTLGHDVAGVIYDVLGKPQHDLLTATPPDKRKLTAGKPCKLCKGAGSMPVLESGSTTVRPCAGCGATGWREAPRLHATQRDTDETLDAFSDRIIDAVAKNVDGYLMREVIVRPEDELVRMRGDLHDWIRLDQHMRTYHDVAPRNDDACFKFNTRCSFLSACRGEADIDDTSLFPRGAIHQELTNAT